MSEKMNNPEAQTKAAIFTHVEIMVPSQALVSAGGAVCLFVTLFMTATNNAKQQQLSDICCRGQSAMK